MYIVHLNDEINNLVNQCEACVKGVVNPVHLHAHEVIREFFPGFTGPPSRKTKLNKHFSYVNIFSRKSKK